MVGSGPPQDALASAIPKRSFDVIVVGSGPSGSVAALLLARSGLEVALIDKARFPRDKACGDVIGPRALRALERLKITTPSGEPVASMQLSFPNATVVELPSGTGLEFDGVGRSIPRRIFDHHLHEQALATGAFEITARVSSVVAQSDGSFVVEAEGGPTSPPGSSSIHLHCRYIIGADGANSKVASDLVLTSPSEALWGFAVRRYIPATVGLPLISLLDGADLVNAGDPKRIFPGYGWAFPSPGGMVNVGVGVGVGGGRKGSSLATNSLTGYIDKLCHEGNLGPVDGEHASSSKQLGGWLKMGMAGTTGGRGGALLVGDAAGLVNPLQGEGIAQAIESASAAAEAILHARSDPSVRYRDYLLQRHAPYQHGSAFLHRYALTHERRALIILGVLSGLPFQHAIAQAWGLYWNDLSDAAGPIPGALLARAMGRSIGLLHSISSSYSRARSPLTFPTSHPPRNHRKK